MKRKVIILTHELRTNYGGLMQAYALQQYIKNLGRLAHTTNVQKSGRIIRQGKYIARLILSKFTKKISNLPPVFTLEISQANNKFIKKYIYQVDPEESLSASFLIVGSDQVWRQAYVDVDKYLFSFVKDDSIPRISYAASFGRDDIDEYSPRMKRKTAKLAKKFKAISVREKSGIKLVRDNWGMDATYHIDPTLLFSADHYSKLIENSTDNLIENKGKVFAYVLDRAGEKGKIIQKVSKLLKGEVFEVLPPKPQHYRDYKKDPEKYNLPPITQWLKGFRDAEFVVTDSFHGCVFSIIYNKPFIAIGNKSRGLGRFLSLLELFNLEDRLVNKADEVTKSLVFEKIDWDQVNKIIQKEQVRSHDYLIKHLEVDNEKNN